MFKKERQVESFLLRRNVLCSSFRSKILGILPTKKKKERNTHTGFNQTETKIPDSIFLLLILGHL